MIPETMRVIEFDAPGGPAVLREGTRPVPRPGPGEVLIRVTAAGVNGPDILQRQGLYPAPPGASDLLGLEVSGEVVALGEGAGGWQQGDRVCALTKGGGYAGYVAAHAGHCLPVPAGVDPVDAAGLPETFFTVWSNIFLPEERPAGTRFLVHGGSGGIGAAAIQLGAAMGWRVFATAGTPKGLDFCRALGAERAIDYRAEDFVAVMKEVGNADVILDIMGGDYVGRNLRAAAMDARIVQLAFRAGSKVEVDLMPLMLRRITYTGSTLRPRPDAFKAETARQLRERVWPLFPDRIRVTTHAVLPMAEAAAAHAMMEAAGHQGKILLRM